MEKLNLVKSSFDQLQNNTEAEQCWIYIAQTVFDDISPIIIKGKFFDPMHQKIFKL